MHTLTTPQTAIVINALHIAIAAYAADADTLTQSGQHRLAEQFKRQHNEAQELLNTLE
jgi:hypothetical protein